MQPTDGHKPVEMQSEQLLLTKSNVMKTKKKKLTLADKIERRNNRFVIFAGVLIIVLTIIGLLS